MLGQGTGTRQPKVDLIDIHLKGHSTYTIHGNLANSGILLGVSLP